MVKEKFGSGTTRTNIEIKHIMKIIKSLENRRILLKETTAKITSPKGGVFNFLKPLITAGLPLMKNVVNQNVVVLIPLGLSAGISTTDAADKILLSN